MTLDLYQIDAFTDRLFKGNPACVVPLENWLADDVLLNIARENAVAETAFLSLMKIRSGYAGLLRKLKWTYVVMRRWLRPMSLGPS